MSTAVIYHGKKSDRVDGVTEIIVNVDGLAVLSGQDVTYKSSVWDKLELVPSRHEPHQLQLPFKDERLGKH